MMIKSFLTFLAVLLASCTLSSGATTARVLGQRVNLRAKPVMTSEVVGQVHDGERLQVKSVQDEWVEVVPPDTVEIWLHRDFLKDGVIVGNKVNVRAGPGINYSVVGTLDRGKTIQEKGTFGEWIRIAPFPEASLWVSKDLLEVSYPKPAAPPSPPAVETAVSAVAPPQPVPGLEGGAVPTPAEPTPAAASRATPAIQEPAPPKDLRLVPVRGQGVAAEYGGVVKPAPYLIGPPSPFRLTLREGNKVKTICYIRGNHEQLKGFLNTEITVKGREYWAENVKEPIVVIESIRLPAQSKP